MVDIPTAYSFFSNAYHTYIYIYTLPSLSFLMTSQDYIGIDQNNGGVENARNYGSIETDQSYANIENGLEPRILVLNTTLTKELKYILNKSIPNVLSFLLQYCLNAFSVFFLSRIGEDKMAAGSLAVTTFFITGPALFIGMATAADTLCLQAYGAGQLQLVGLYFQRNVVLSFIMYVPLSILWLNLGSILGIFVEDAEIVRLAQNYLRISIFEAPAIILFENGKRFVQAQGIFHATSYALAVVVPVNLILNYTLIVLDKFSIGFMGAPVSSVLSYWLLDVLLWAYVVFVDGIQCWTPIKKASFTNLSQLVSLNAYGAIMVLMECLAFEAATFMASTFGVRQLAAQLVTMTLGNMFFEIAFAVSVVGLMRIGLYIGSQDKRAAIIAVRALYLIMGTLGVTNCFMAFLYKDALADWFSNGDHELAGVISKTMTIVAIFQLLDSGVNVSLQAILRAQGRQKIGGILAIISYHCVGLAFEIYLAFHLNWQLYGLWCGLAIGLSFLSFLNLMVVVWSDWNHVMETAQKHF